MLICISMYVLVLGLHAEADDCTMVCGVKIALCACLNEKP